ncbi:deoxyribose-phosphate aldolase [Homo sapiens]|uniref:Deoxyribose-phosphate aldolase n=2 Tax=Hominidae TaxID=9604 RepID=E9PJ44_HUMAN|nr:deoxyribose-phosphate aldolase [Homo sapiens]KAI4064896.1 deoxyribose-phosphate aldolase [Homo sapiens]PNJ26899.1 DERA isoform 2 [Pongo abelii]
MSAHNRGTELDLSWISKIQVNHPAVLRRAEQIQARRTVKKEWQALLQPPFVFIPPGCVML